MSQIVKENRRGKRVTEYVEDTVTGEIVAKRCGSCGEMKALENFNKSVIHFAGTVSTCKKCTRERDKKYYEKNKDKKHEYYERRYKENKEKRSEYAKAYYQKNREKMIEQAKERYKEKRVEQLLKSKNAES
jgi:hypothetical protein